MKRVSKIIILGLLFFICCSIAGSALAADTSALPKLEQRYPSLPIIGSLDDGRELPPEERMSFYVKYFINIFFFIVVGVCVVVLLLAGVAYVAPPVLGKIISITTAKTMIRNAFLGLFILATSYTVLYAINPDLLFLSLDIPELQEPTRFGDPPYGPNDIVYGRVLAPSTLRRIVEGLGEKVYLDDRCRYYEEINGTNCFTDGYGNFVDEDGKYLRGDDIKCVDSGVPVAKKYENRFLAVLIDRASAAFLPSTGPITDYNPCGQDFVYRAEIPFFDTYNTLDKAILEIDGRKEDDPLGYYPGLTELLNNCSCGLSMFHVKWQGLNTYCVGGVDPESYEAEIATDACSRQADNCGKAKDTDGANRCDLHEVVTAVKSVKVAGEAEPKDVKLTMVEIVLADDEGNPKAPEWRYLPDDWKALNWEPAADWEPWKTEDNATRDDPLYPLNPGKKDLINPDLDIIKPERLIKYRVIKLEEILETLESQKRMFFPKQAGFLANTLSINKIEFLVSNVKEGIFNADFDAEKEEYEAEGYTVSIEDMQETGQATGEGTVEPAPSADSRSGMLARLKGFFNPPVKAQYYEYLGAGAGALYFKIHADGSVAPEKEITYNKFIKRESNRINLFSVLSGLTLETIESFFNDCLSTAFGKANYQLDKEELEGVIEQAGKEGVLERFEKDLVNKLDDINAQAAMKVGFAEAIDTDVSKRMIIDQCAGCEEAGIDTPEEINELMQMAENGSCSNWTTCCECAEDLLKNKMPPHFVSKTILKFLTTGIEDYFDSVSTLLDTKMRNIFFEEGGEINDFLDEEMITIYNKILNSAFDKSLAEHIPGLDNLLQAQMKDVLPDVVTKQLNKVDRFLKCTISGCCTPAADKTQCMQEVFREHPENDTKYCCDPNKEYPADIAGRKAFLEDEKKCRTVINKYKCRNEKYRTVGGIKQCCQDGMAQWIKAHSSDYLKEKTKQYITEPINQWTENMICDKGLSTDCAHINRCVSGEWLHRVFRPKDALASAPMGYNQLFTVPELKYFGDSLDYVPTDLLESDLEDLNYFFIDGSANRGYPGPNFGEPLTGTCEKLTPDDVNNLSKPGTLIPIFEFINVKDGKVEELGEDGQVADLLKDGFKNADTISNAAIEQALVDDPELSKEGIEAVRAKTEQVLENSIEKRVLLIQLSGASKEKANEIKQKICHNSGHEWSCDKKVYVSTKDCCFDDDCGEGYTCKGAINDCEGVPGCEACDLTGDHRGKCEAGLAQMDWDYDTSDCRCVDADVLTQDIAAGAVGTMGDLRNTGSNILGGLARYGSQLLTALIDTLVHTAIEYAKVVIEDRIVAPFKDAFDTVVGFQEGIGKFLEKSVAQVLPEEISGVLQDNIDKVIADVCQQLRRLSDEDAEVTISIALPKDVTWEDETKVDAVENVPVSAKTKKTLEQAFCRTSTHLHTTVLGEIAAMGSIGRDLDNLLSRSLERHLNSLCPDDPEPACPNDNWDCPEVAGSKKQPAPKCVSEFLDKSLIQILWPGLKNIEELIKGTPKQLLCGEIAFDVEGWGAPGVKVKPAGKCADMKKAEFGIFPALDMESPVYETLKAEGKIDKYAPWCNFMYLACENPFKAVAGEVNKLTMPAGKFIEKTAGLACAWAKDEAAKPMDPPGDMTPQCQGACLGVGNPSLAMEKDIDCPKKNKNYCRGCNFMLKDTVAYTTFYQAIKRKFWLPRDGCADCAYHKYPAVLDADLTALKENEKKVYIWLLVYFKDDLENDIRAVVEKRGLGSDWAEINAAAAALDKMDFPITGSESELLLLLGSWVMNGSPTLKDLITAVPLGVIKGIKPGEPTLFLPNSNEKKNFLDKTPYKLLKDYACKSIETAYKAKYPVTFEALAQQNKTSIPGVWTSYDIESVDTWTKADRLGVIASFQIEGAPPVDEDLRNSYLFCKMLDLTPAESLGLDQRLKTYIRPKEFIILFDLMYKELRRDERPEGLNDVLDYLYNQTPVAVLKDVASSLDSDVGGSEYRILFEASEEFFLGLIIGETIEVLNDIDRDALKSIFANTIIDGNALILSDDAYLSDPPVAGNINGEPIWGFLDNQYYLTVIGDSLNRIIKVYDSPGTAEKLLMQLSTILGTQLGKQINRGIMDDRIIDVICEHPNMQRMTDDGNKESLCKWRPTDGIDRFKILQQEFLDKTPMQLIVKYLTEPIGPSPLTDPKMTAMDMLAANSVLGEPYLDTFVRWLPFGAEEKFFGLVNKAQMARKWVDYGVNTGVTAVQQGLETALLEYPREAAAALAKLISEKMGEKTAEQIAGKCYPLKIGDACAEGYVRREKPGGQVDCCSLAGKYVCHDVCRAAKGIEQCDLIKGEIEKWMENVDGDRVRHCCFEKDDTPCRKCRKVNADLTQCRKTTDETTDEKTRTTVETDSGKFTVCCHDEEQIPDPGSGVKKCCISVADCVANKFADHMEVMADMLAEGFLPVKLKPD